MVVALYYLHTLSLIAVNVVLLDVLIPDAYKQIPDVVKSALPSITKVLEKESRPASSRLDHSELYKGLDEDDLEVSILITLMVY